MLPTATIELHEKLALVWAERRRQLLALRVYYTTTLDRGCKIYCLRQTEELS